MNITVSYIGVNNGNFLKLNFYINVGFANFITHNTGIINPAYHGPIIASAIPKKISIGERIRVDDNQKQTVVLTPFFGMGQLGYDDIDALSTWL
ncbi:hypothetical protein LCGC14_2357820 [marine sediment metagenome]|uniref:Uncharacterized protein n=1 Tax=marine sediment metagenome TaxID=412755 RepID=A0A0F9C7R8_9ZZZZ